MGQLKLDPICEENPIVAENSLREEAPLVKSL